VKLAINTDAHSQEGLRDIGLGVSTARRGWVRAGDVINCMKTADLKRFLTRKR
jgi:DNA polymerase (family 10)